MRWKWLLIPVLLGLCSFAFLGCGFLQTAERMEWEAQDLSQRVQRIQSLTAQYPRNTAALASAREEIDGLVSLLEELEYTAVTPEQARAYREIREFAEEIGGGIEDMLQTQRNLDTQVATEMGDVVSLAARHSESAQQLNSQVSGLMDMVTNAIPGAAAITAGMSALDNLRATAEQRIPPSNSTLGFVGDLAPNLIPLAPLVPLASRKVRRGLANRLRKSILGTDKPEEFAENMEKARIKKANEAALGAQPQNPLTLCPGGVSPQTQAVHPSGPGPIHQNWPPTGQHSTPGTPPQVPPQTSPQGQGGQGNPLPGENLPTFPNAPPAGATGPGMTGQWTLREIEPVRETG